MFVLWLDEPACQNINLTGGKAANLSRLAANHPVPPGFCVTTTAYDAWSPAAHAGELTPPPLTEVVTAAYAALSQQMQVDEPSVAVRSSAVREDGQNASFAGQYETYLNLVGIDAVVSSILHCWQSAQSDRVLAYQGQKDDFSGESPLAVLVQALIPADVSFVAFSANPVTRNRDEVVINASWGLGESVVSGTVTPDAYRIEKATPDKAWTLTEHLLSDKQRMTIASAEGVREVKVPRTMRKKPALTEAQYVEIAQLATELEHEMGWPVDIEGAYQGDTLYLLQCRPVSTLV